MRWKKKIWIGYRFCAEHVSLLECWNGLALWARFRGLFMVARAFGEGRRKLKGGGIQIR